MRAAIGGLNYDMHLAPWLNKPNNRERNDVIWSWSSGELRYVCTFIWKDSSLQTILHLKWMPTWARGEDSAMGATCGKAKEPKIWLSDRIPHYKYDSWSQSHNMCIDVLISHRVAWRECHRVWDHRQLGNLFRSSFRLTTKTPKFRLTGPHTEPVMQEVFACHNVNMRMNLWLIRGISVMSLM